MNQDCGRFREILSAVSDGEEGAFPRESVSLALEHSRECPRCQAFCKDLSSLRTALQAPIRRGLPASLKARILSKASTHGHTGITLSERILALVKVPSVTWALALVMLVAVGFFFHPNGRTSSGVESWNFSEFKSSTLKGENLELAQGGSVLARDSSGNRLKIWGGPGTLVFSSPGKDSGAKVTLRDGRSCFSWETKHPMPFSVDCGNLRIDVKGTAWRVSKRGESSTVEVGSGRILVTTSQTRVELGAMQGIEVDASGKVTGPVSFNSVADPELGEPLTNIIKGSR